MRAVETLRQCGSSGRPLKIDLPERHRLCCLSRFALCFLSDERSNLGTWKAAGRDGDRDFEAHDVQPKDFLSKVGGGRTNETYRAKEPIFAQGDVADSVFFIQKGKVKVTVISEHGKEAIVAVLDHNEFLGEGCLAGQKFRFAPQLR